MYSELNEIIFYIQSPPKSLGVEWNDEVLKPILNEYSESPIEDIMHTFTQHVARQISLVLKGEGKRVLVSGGGAFNEYLIDLIKEKTSHDIIIENEKITDFKEAIVFSFLAVLRVRGEVNCLSEVTGASIDHSTGIVFDFLS